MCLGDLYMDAEQPANAIKAYAEAANFFEREYGEDDLSTIEAKLSLADAYLAAGNSAQGRTLVTKNIKILEELLSFNEEDMAEAEKDDDTETQYVICEETAGICEYLGWAYEMAGNKTKSDEYYTRADEDCE